MFDASPGLSAPLPCVLVHLGADELKKGGEEVGEDDSCESGVWIHFLLKGTQGGLPGGGGNGTSTTVLNSSLGDADPASKAPKMLP